MSLEVGLKDVALRAGVSPSTASNALSGARYVSAETRQRVFEIAEAMNYRPNLVARGLRRQETRTISLLVNDIANPYYPAVARAIHDRIGAHGYVSFIGNTDGDPETEVRVLEEMRSRSVDGVIMGTMALSPERIRSVVGPTMPLVLLTGESLESPEHEIRQLRADEVGTDDSIGIREAVEHLRNQGVTDIGYVSGPVGSIPGTGRMQRFRDELTEAGLRVNENWIEFASSYTLETGYDAADRLLGRSNRPAAIMCANDLIAIGVLEAARDRGLAVPTDLAVIGFDDIPTAKHVSPRLTTIINPATLVGYACADALMRRIEHPDVPFEHTALPTHLIARGSA
ncbi:LacI family transcriptional regulator [Diaminobutyricibacter tongyongensis]|uniref:LacI family transcriptional regulator n=1 Tax=Leifsonia tongyongensis TaxID=1268043 RepID=A0A6L9Y1X8_9MICO|nr:LacI family DNA-binding transcriptional regulator [Diaminobutyricibacter tongyongensis]NEN07691.1 LacI family transcriptional regulator [Diaminobutyricibacter tongyongensis]